MTKKISHTSGVGLTEVIVAVAIISFSLIGIVGAFNFYIKASIENADKIRAVYLLEEGVEAVRLLRDGDWTSNISTLTTYTSYYLAIVGNTWEATTTSSLIDDTFDRTFTLRDI